MVLLSTKAMSFAINSLSENEEERNNKKKTKTKTKRKREEEGSYKKRQKPGTPGIKGQLRDGFCQFPVITRKSSSRPLLESGSSVTSFLSQ